MSYFRPVLGCFYCFFWFFSIFAGFFVLICPALPLAIFAPKLYRRWSDIVFGMWEPYPVAMMEIVLGVGVTMSGDTIDPSEGSVVIMNHRTRLDWNFLWAGFFHSAHPHSHSLKFILKAPIMHIPGPGWVMQACSFLFIHRHWDTDQQLLANSLDYLRETKRSCQILIFPEGTDLTASSMERSHGYADKSGLARYFRVLHPKTTGFVYIVNKMRRNGQLDAVYDLTVGYPRGIAQTEMDLLCGNFPAELHFNVQRHDLSELPTSDVELRNWLSQTWKHKEHMLHRFYSCGSFTDHDFTPDCLEQNSTNELLKKQGLADFHNVTSHKHPTNHTTYNKLGKSKRSTPGNTLHLALIFWTSLVLGFFYALYQSFYFLAWVSVWFTTFICLSFVSDGFHQVLAWYNKPAAVVRSRMKKYE